MKILALMSGSSLDGLDIALIDISTIGNSSLEWNIVEKDLIAYDSNWRNKLINLPLESALSYVKTKAAYSLYIAKMVNEFIIKYNLFPDLIAWHGHTIFHLPELKISEQIGEGGIMAGITNTKTITDFRITDISINGQGTPLVPIVEQLLFPGYEYYLNLGGIANISIHQENKIFAYDVCPTNQLLNHLSMQIDKPYDNNGENASKGQVDYNLLKKMSQFDYYNKKYPKSLDNNWIRDTYFPLFNGSTTLINDKLATANQFILDKIYNELKISQRIFFKQRETRLFVTGGGTHNGFLIQNLYQRLKELNIELIVPPKEIVDYKETILMALMGYLRVNNKTNVLASVTGAKRNTIGGAIYLP